MKDESIHTVPTWEEHATDGLDCWCVPTSQLPCDECQDGCWKCEGGVIHLSRAEAEHAPRPLVIVHNASEQVAA